MACMIDFRCLDEGSGGQKNKRKRHSSPTQMDLDDDATATAPSKRPALPSPTDPDKPAAFLGRPTYDGVIAGRVSGRKWKQPRTRRASASKVSLKGKSLEEREREKKIKRAFRERKEELKEEIRKHKVEKRERREEMEKRKKENELRSGMKLQKISNPKTLQKIAKSKKKKLLRVVPDDVFDKNKKKTEGN